MSNQVVNSREYDCEPGFSRHILSPMEGRRRLPRYLYGGQGELLFAPEVARHEVIIMSVSMEGCRIEGKGLPTAGKQCEVRFGWQGMEFMARGEIAWLGKDGTAGLRFLKVNDESKVTLKELCANLRLEPLGPRPAHF